MGYGQPIVEKDDNADATVRKVNFIRVLSHTHAVTPNKSF